MVAKWWITLFHCKKIRIKLQMTLFRYIEWRNEYTVSNFFYTWNMVHDFFITQLQDINKVGLGFILELP